MLPPPIIGSMPSDVLHTVIDIFHPVSILEIGFHHGHSALTCLSRGCQVTSVDIVDCPVAVTYLQQCYPEQFTFLCMDSSDIDSHSLYQQFDFAIIDGDHYSPQVEIDAIKCLELNIPYILFDDTRHLGHPNIPLMIDRFHQAGIWDIVWHQESAGGKTVVRVRENAWLIARRFHYVYRIIVIKNSRQRPITNF